MTELNWQWPIIVYLWAAGVAGGAYFATFLAHKFSGGHYHEARRAAAGLGIPAVILGVVMLLIDLGHPVRAWHLFVRFRPFSPMSLGSWLLLLWSVLAVLLFLSWWGQSLAKRGAAGGIARVIRAFAALRGVEGLLDWLTFFLSILLIAYTGVLLSTTNVPLWSSTFLLPALFVSSAISTGIAAINLLGAVGMGAVDTSLMSKLCKGSAIACVVEILALAGLLLWAAGTPATALAYAAEPGAPCPAGLEVRLETIHQVNILVGGDLSFAFWVGVVLVGLVIPLGSEFTLILRGEERPSRELLVLLTLMVLAGGFILRAVIVFAGQM